MPEEQVELEERVYHYLFLEGDRLVPGNDQLLNKEYKVPPKVIQIGDAKYELTNQFDIDIRRVLVVYIAK